MNPRDIATLTILRVAFLLFLHDPLSAQQPGVLIPELGLVYNNGVLTDPLTGKVSASQNTNAKQTQWGLYRPNLDLRTPRQLTTNAQKILQSPNALQTQMSRLINARNNKALNQQQQISATKAQNAQNQALIQNLIRANINRLLQQNAVQNRNLSPRLNTTYTVNTNTRNKLLPVNNLLKTSVVAPQIINKQVSARPLNPSELATQNLILNYQRQLNLLRQNPALAATNNALRNTRTNYVNAQTVLQNANTLLQNQLRLPNRRITAQANVPRFNLQNVKPGPGYVTNANYLNNRINANVKQLPGTSNIQSLINRNNAMPNNYHKQIYSVQGTLNSFLKQHTGATLKPQSHTTTIVTTTPAPLRTTTNDGFWNMYDWNWSDPYQNPLDIASTMNPLSDISSATTPHSIPIGGEVTGQGAAISNSSSTSVSFLNSSDTAVSTTPPQIISNTTLSPKATAAFLKKLLKPPFKPQYYEQICIHLNKTNPNKTGHSFGPIQEDCGQYVKCDVFNGFFFPKESICTIGLWYDTGTGTCVDADAVSCLYNPCSKLANGAQVNIPYPGSCDWFITCEGGSATAEMCEAGINFDSVTGMCCLPTAFCPCFEQPPNATPDYQLQSFMRNFQFHDQGPALQREIGSVFSPSSLNIDNTELCREKPCSWGLIWNKAKCKCARPY